MFQQMQWNYSTLFISEQDYKLAAKPKKVLTAQLAVWGAGALSVNAIYMRNPEIFYKRFLLTVWCPIFAVLPLFAIGRYF